MLKHLSRYAPLWVGLATLVIAVVAIIDTAAEIKRSQARGAEMSGLSSPQPGVLTVVCNGTEVGSLTVAEVLELEREARKAQCGCEPEVDSSEYFEDTL